MLIIITTYTLLLNKLNIVQVLFTQLHGNNPIFLIFLRKKSKLFFLLFLLSSICISILIRLIIWDIRIRRSNITIAIAVLVHRDTVIYSIFIHIYILCLGCCRCWCVFIFVLVCMYVVFDCGVYTAV